MFTMTLVTMLTLLLINWQAPLKILWESVSFLSALFAALFSFQIFFMGCTSNMFFTDEISAPLVIMTLWLFPFTMVASKFKLESLPAFHQRMFIFNNILLLFFSLWALMAFNHLLFFIFFEASFITPLVITKKWGDKNQRPVVNACLTLHVILLTLFLFLWIYSYSNDPLSLYALPPCHAQIVQNYPQAFLDLLIVSFMIKLPIFSFYLWLPKNPAEFIAANSMPLAGALLKLTGYGLFRISTFTTDFSIPPCLVLMLAAIFMTMVAASIYAQRNDVKTTAAVASLTNMIIVVITHSMFSSLSISLTLIIMHSIISSALYCLANTAYHRNNTWTFIGLRQSLLIIPLLSLWLLQITMIIKMWAPTYPPSNWLILICVMTASLLILSTAWTLFVLRMVQQTSVIHYFRGLTEFKMVEHMLLCAHGLLFIPILFYLV